MMISERLQVLRYGTYDDDGVPLTRKDGTLVEFVLFLDQAASVWQVTLDPATAGADRPGEGEWCVAELRCSLEAKPAYSRAGREYVANKYRWAVLRFRPQTDAPNLGNGSAVKASPLRETGKRPEPTPAAA